MSEHVEPEITAEDVSTIKRLVADPTLAELELSHGRRVTFDLTTRPRPGMWPLLFVYQVDGHAAHARFSVAEEMMHDADVDVFREVLRAELEAGGNWLLSMVARDKERQ